MKSKEGNYFTNEDITLLKKKQEYAMNLLLFEESLKDYTVFLNYEIQGSKRSSLANKIYQHNGVSLYIK